MLIIYFTLAILSATLFALLEVQIESSYGWAAKLPTWRIYFSWFKYLPGSDKPLTGYHLYLWVFLTAYPHILFVFTPWSTKAELLLISFILLVLRLEDFIYFLVNPSFGIKKFHHRYIPWHTNWLGPLPIQYYYSFIIWGTLLF